MNCEDEFRRKLNYCEFKGSEAKMTLILRTLEALVTVHCSSETYLQHERQTENGRAFNGRASISAKIWWANYCTTVPIALVWGMRLHGYMGKCVSQ